MKSPEKPKGSNDPGHPPPNQRSATQFLYEKHYSKTEQKLLKKGYPYQASSQNLILCLSSKELQALEWKEAHSFLINFQSPTAWSVRKFRRGWQR